MTFTTRFAPSPTGPLHLGHAYSAIIAYKMAQANAGRFLLRIEDIDSTRASPKWEAQIYEDLAWLGLKWETPVMRQSDRLALYDHALDALWGRGLLYPCSCSRADIAAASSAPQEGAPLNGPDGIIYPGTCRPVQPPKGPRPVDIPLRLDMARACGKITGQFEFVEEGSGSREHITFGTEEMISTVGDVVLARRGMGTSYHLSVVIDDAAQEISHVVRGSDLFEATRIHIVLQRLLDLPHPRYHHHKLIRDTSGKRLAKRDDARAISLYRDEEHTVKDILSMIGLEGSHLTL